MPTTATTAINIPAACVASSASSFSASAPKSRKSASDLPAVPLAATGLVPADECTAETARRDLEHVMTTTPIASASAAVSHSWIRLAGIAGVASTILGVGLGAGIASGAPTFVDPADEIRTWFGDNQGQVALFTWLMPLVVGPLLLTFAAGLRSRLAAVDGTGVLRPRDGSLERSGPMRLMPILEWLPKYRRENIRFDLIAGVTVAALVVPKSLGYAGIAQVPIQNGLYAAAAAALLYALFGTSRQIATGPSSALAAVAASAVLTSGLAGEDAPQLVAAVTLTAGVLFLLLAVFKMGWLSQFLSKAVITGFLFGAAIEVVSGELPKITGTDAEGEDTWQKLDSWLDGVDGYDGTTLLVGIVSLVAIVAIRFLVPKLPGARVLVVGGLLAAAVFDLADEGVATVGDVPRGLRPPSTCRAGRCSATTSTRSSWPRSPCCSIGFSQTAGDARSFASQHSYRVDVNQESVAQGFANLGSGAVQGIPVSTSLSASSLNDSSGARTQMASVVTGMVVVAHPAAVRAAVLRPAQAGAGRHHHRRRGVRDDGRGRDAAAPAGQPRSDFWIAIAAIRGRAARPACWPASSSASCCRSGGWCGSTSAPRPTSWAAGPVPPPSGRSTPSPTARPTPASW